MAISGYTSIDRQFGASLAARLGAVNAEAVTVDEGGSVGDISLGRYSTIIQPIAIPTSATINHSPITYTVLAGDNLGTIAAKFHLSVADLRWSNTSLFSNDSVAAGDKILIPPLPGIVVTTNASDTLDRLGAKYQVDPQVIYDFNRLRSPQLVAGTLLVIPNGVGGTFPPPPAQQQLLTLGVSTSFDVKVLGCCFGPYLSTDAFPAGWCTYYVASWRKVTWNGNAGSWYDNAKAKGYSVGPTPKVGAIMVAWESSLGHVAYVQSVNPDGSWVVTEMAWAAYGVIDQRTIKPGQLGSRLVGFIY